MKRLHFDSLGGASGDLVLAALIGLGADPAYVRETLARLGVHGYTLEIQTATTGGISGTQVRVHVESHTGQHPHRHSHPHRRLRDILGLIQSAALPPGATALAVRAFKLLADAEAQVHGCTPDDVHFHEVGAVDSIVDIVGSCVALDALAVDAVTVGPLPLGSGTIQCEHGVIPIPAPATVRLLTGHDVLPCSEEPFELVTPTGAALLMTFKTGPIPTSVARLTATANAIGHRKLATRPNLLRAFLFENDAIAGGSLEGECLLLECNIDDSNPELLGSALTRLIAEAGALDAFLTPVQMKKQRPGILLTVLCEPGRRGAVLDLLFRETTTFGVRESLVRRTMLARRWMPVHTPWGEVRVKIGTWNGRDLTWAPEHDDCLSRATEHGVPVRAVYEAARLAATTRRE